MEVHPVSAPPRAMDWSPSSQAIHRRMDAVVQQKPELKEAVMFYRSLLPILRAAEAEVQAFPLDAEAVRRKFDAGVPVLVQEELPLDIPVHSRVFSQVCQLIESSPEKDPPTVSLAGESPPDPSTPAARQGETAGEYRSPLTSGWGRCRVAYLPVGTVTTGRYVTKYGRAGTRVPVQRRAGCAGRVGRAEVQC